jgi:opacity protein-like surface antigen
MAVAIDLEGFYITPKGGVSKSMDTGTTYESTGGRTLSLTDEDLGTGTAFGLSVGKYISDNFRLELEAIKRTSYEFDAAYNIAPEAREKADIDSKSLFINAFYDFKSFDISSTSVTPYLGGGVGISSNKVSSQKQYNEGAPNGGTFNDKTISQFAYKLSAGSLFSLTEKLSLDINYQYVDLGSFKGGNELYANGVLQGSIDAGLNGGEIKTQELMVGLQYKF